MITEWNSTSVQNLQCLDPEGQNHSKLRKNGRLLYGAARVLGGSDISSSEIVAHTQNYNSTYVRVLKFPTKELSTVTELQGLWSAVT